MTKLNFCCGMLFGALLLIASCSSDPCDDLRIPPGFICDDGDVRCNMTCGTGEVLLANCTCATDASTIVPDPCFNTPVCAEGEVKAYPGCNCVDLMTDPCQGVTCGPFQTCVNGDCQTISFSTVTVRDNITSDVTWTNTNIYVLGGRIAVEDGATLTIEAGTVIKGATGQQDNATALVVARGGKIMAEGTAELPIIMTTILDDIIPGQTAGSNLDETDNGEWGGLLILGRAPISVDGDAPQAQIEGIPADDINGLYGGTDVMDNSGVLRYVSVRHGGTDIGADNEINGVTLGGVGAGTVIDHLEVVGNKDDGIEWFGGTVNVSNALVWAADDDALDIDQAYSGTINNAVVIAFGGTDHGLEIDGPEGSTAGSFTLSNVTIKGADDELGNLRDGATGALSNIYFFGFTENPADEAGEGDFRFSGDNTDAAYAAGLLTFAGLEMTPAMGVSAADVFKDFTAEDLAAVGIVDAGANTVGANTSVFSWTMAAARGALSF